MLDTLADHRIGKIRVKVGTDYDPDPDTSYLGEAIDYREARQWTDKYAVYSYEDDAIRLPGSDIWRDRKGRIVAEPERLDRWDSVFYHRDIEFLKLDSENYKGEPHKLRYLFQDADRLRAYYRNDWAYFGIIARVYANGREIGNASVWGFESDMGDSEFKAEARNIARDAIAEARQWLESLAVA